MNRDGNLAQLPVISTGDKKNVKTFAQYFLSLVPELESLQDGPRLRGALNSLLVPGDAPILGMSQLPACVLPEPSAEKAFLAAIQTGYTT